MVPAGFSKFAQGRQLGIDLLEAGANGAEQALPASVGATLRVVRVSSPSRSSSPRMVWLSVPVLSVTLVVSSSGSGGSATSGAEAG